MIYVYYHKILIEKLVPTTKKEPRLWHGSFRKDGNSRYFKTDKILIFVEIACGNTGVNIGILM